jgi:hypothetical protein
MSSPPAHITLDVINDLFESQVRSKVANLQRLDLLSALESLANDLFSTHEAFASHRNAFGSDPESVQSTVHSTVACLWDRIEDGSPDFYTAVEVTTARSRLVTGLILRSLRAFSGAGFNDFERLLVENSASLCVLYDIWYKSWNRAVRKPDVVKAIESCTSKAFKPSVREDLCISVSLVSRNCRERATDPFLVMQWIEPNCQATFWTTTRSFTSIAPVS